MELIMARVKLTPESIAFAIAEGTELFKNSRSLNYRDTVQTKINNSLVGTFGQQLFIEGTSGHRVTREECPGFAYDVTCTNHAVRSYCSWADEKLDSQSARVEVKVRPIEGRSWISFNDQMFRHVTRCAKQRMLDYVAFYGIQNIDLEAYEADVGFLGIIKAEVLNDEDLRRPSIYTKGDSFLNKNRIHSRNLGKIFL
jgi:hypothetical protein